MSNTYKFQFLYSKNPMLTLLQGSATIGASGAVASYTGSGISSVEELATGVYSINLSDSYARFLNADLSIRPSTTGSAIASGSLVTGTLYQITVVGTTDWHTVGVPTNITPAVGVAFVATGTAAGTGTATEVSQSGIFQIEIAGDPQTMINPVISKGGRLVVRMSDATGALAAPATGSVIFFDLLLRDSRALGANES